VDEQDDDNGTEAWALCSRALHSTHQLNRSRSTRQAPWLALNSARQLDDADRAGLSCI